jgi:dihydrodipicolinate reductase
MSVKVGINGFGRIGRNVMRACLGNNDIEFVGVNDLTDTKTLAHLFKYDSIMGNLDHRVVASDGVIKVEGDEFRVFSEKDPAAIPWEEVGAEIVIESTGRFTKAEDAKKHLHGPVKKVVISAPAKGEDVTVVLGVNEQMYDPANLRVIGHIQEDQGLSSIQIGQKVLFTVDAFGSKQFTGTVENIGNLADQSSLAFSISDKRQEKQFDVTVVFDSSAYPELANGMSAKMWVYK